MDQETTWYCSTKGSYLTFSSIEALLIRGVSQNTIFTVEAKNKIEACIKSHEFIERLKLKNENGKS